MTMLPPSRPRMGLRELTDRLLRIPEYLENVNSPWNKVQIIGIRGYYKNTMGEPDKNDIGIYDDAIFIKSANTLTSFNANTDPSKLYPHTATLVPGYYPSYCLGYHRGKYMAVVQRMDEVVVKRENRDTVQKGYFGINIHKGSLLSTSSEGCQTIYPDQWNGFMSLLIAELMREYPGLAVEINPLSPATSPLSSWNSKHRIPYILMEE